MMKTLIFIEKDFEKECFGLTEICEKIKDDKDDLIYGIGFDIDETKLPFDKVFNIDSKVYNQYSHKEISQIMYQLQKKHEFDNIIILASVMGRMLAPVLACKLGAGLVADVTAIEKTDNDIIMIRPAFDGKLFAYIKSQTKPIMMSVRPNIFEKSIDIKDTIIENIDGIDIKKSTLVVTNISVKEKSEDIRDSKVLVSGGGGIIDDFDKVKMLANLINAKPAASRRLVDSKVASRDIQVGQSGKTVSPNLYIAIGIYGSLQHIEGLKNIKYIISVNTDKFAPICSLSDIVVEGDGVVFIDKLMEKIENKSHKLN